MQSNDHDKAERRSTNRFLWLLFPFLVLGAVAVGCGYVTVVVYFCYPFYRYLLFSLCFPPTIGILGGRFAVRSLWRASFQGNNRKSIKSAIGFPLCIWIAMLYFGGMIAAYPQFTERPPNEWVSLVFAFVNNETIPVLVFSLQMIFLIVVFIATIWKPYRFPF